MIVTPPQTQEQIDLTIQCEDGELQVQNQTDRNQTLIKNISKSPSVHHELIISLFNAGLTSSLSSPSSIYYHPGSPAHSCRCLSLPQAALPGSFFEQLVDHLDFWVLSLLVDFCPIRYGFGVEFGQNVI